MPRSSTPAALLDAAEKLFAENAISAVSDRRVAEAAGNANNSAVKYHFGGRDGLLRALIERHVTALEGPRERLHLTSRTLLGDVRSLVIPVTTSLAALPQPTYRARFLARALVEPGPSDLYREVGPHAPVATRLLESITARVPHLDRTTLTARARQMTRVVSFTCADVEAESHREGTTPDWPAVGTLLADTIAGMLSAPTSRADSYPSPDEQAEPVP
ncbi:TetR/AcrR family transcriptional regulator [Nocardioides sp. CPCC 205120]|uniref:TetR/AcrR family transcriptional regulator n=1 Tax=Nocardioides sp. CPCC 205120 TaxID=3406462 RepID=UPI003B5148A7